MNQPPFVETFLTGNFCDFGNGSERKGALENSEFDSLTRRLRLSVCEHVNAVLDRIDLMNNFKQLSLNQELFLALNNFYRYCKLKHDTFAINFLLFGACL